MHDQGYRYQFAQHFCERKIQVRLRLKGAMHRTDCHCKRVHTCFADKGYRLVRVGKGASINAGIVLL